MINAEIMLSAGLDYIKLYAFSERHRIDYIELCEAVYAAVTSSEKRHVTPKGWKLVPVNPTPEMLDRGRWQEFHEESSHMRDVEDDEILLVWQQMIDVAPEFSEAEILR